MWTNHDSCKANDCSFRYHQLNVSLFAFALSVVVLQRLFFTKKPLMPLAMTHTRNASDKFNRLRE